ncbi:Arm DNA-binding domain-containing protein, partial [Oleiphilus sp. HI0123]
MSKKTEFKIPKGVEIHGNNIRIAFQLDGKRMREPITGILKINQNSLNYAANKRAVILNEIKSGSFDYQAHFPNSQNALKYSGSV